MYAELYTPKKLWSEREEDSTGFSFRINISIFDFPLFYLDYSFSDKHLCLFILGFGIVVQE